MTPQKIYVPVKYDSDKAIFNWSHEQHEWQIAEGVEEQDRYVFSKEELEKLLLHVAFNAPYFPIDENDEDHETRAFISSAIENF